VKRIHKFLKLSWRDQLLLLYAVFVVAAVTLGLWVLPWPALQSQLLKLTNWCSRFGTIQRPPAEHIAWAVKVAGSLIPKATCLPQALAAQLLLNQNAYSAELKIGVVRNEAGKLGAHAWVTSEGNILIGSVQDLDRFVPLSSVESQGIEDYGRAV
jgi:hypothetical protein